MRISDETPNKGSTSFIYGIEHVVVVYSPSGGAGTTTLATNLAAALTTSKTRVLLLDCNLQFGQVDTFLNLQSQSNFVDLVKQIEELDVELVESILVTHNSGLKVLTAPTHPEYARDVASSKIIDLVANLASIFDVIVVDAPSRCDDLTYGLFEIAERILLITNPTIPSVRSTKMLLDLFDRLGEPAQFANKVIHVLNRVSSERERGRHTVPASSIVKHLKIVDPIIIPQDDRAVLTSINQGVPFIINQREASPSQEILQLAKQLDELFGLSADYTSETPTTPRIESPALTPKPDTPKEISSEKEHSEELKLYLEAEQSPVHPSSPEISSAVTIATEKEVAPLSDQEPDTHIKLEKHEYPPVTPENIRVLIADSVPEMRENIRKLLAFEPVFDVVGLASTGREAIELAKQFNPDVILLGVDMPDIDGISATTIISKEVHTAAVIIMSGQSEPGMLRRAMLAGARDFLTKPIVSEELYTTLRRVYDRNMPRRAHMTAMSARPVTMSPAHSIAPETSGGLIRKPITHIEVGDVSGKAEKERPKQGLRALFGKKETTSEATLENTIQYSAFYPEFVQASQHYVLMIFAHLEAALDEVSKVAAGFEGLMGGKVKRDSVASITPVSLGRLLTFVPQVEGIVFKPSEQIITWRPPFQSANFLFSTPGNLDGDLKGRVLIFQGPLIIGEILLDMKLLRAHAPTTKSLLGRSSFEHFDPVFASYSHKDTPVMEYFRQSRENLGQKMLVDIYDLRAGEHWQDRLLEMIDESAVFQLFWSEYSAQSAYCRKEWQYALKYQDSRPRFIQPVWWKMPMPSPPSELVHLHFQKVNVPLDT